MRNFWIILEPYTFLWSNSKCILLYNSLSQKSFLIKNNKILNPIILELEDEKNLYCISIKETALEDLLVKKFVRTLRYSYCGDIISHELCKNKPLVIYPSLNINEDGRDTTNIQSKEILGKNILNNLINVDIYLGGVCSKGCIYCKSKYKQVCWCKQDNNVFDYYMLCKLLNEISALKLVKVNFIGDIFSYLQSYNLIDVLKDCNLKKVFTFDYHFAFKYKNEIIQILKYGIKINLLIGDTNEIEQLLMLPFVHDQNVEYNFSVESAEEFFFFSDFIFKHNLTNTAIYPYFNGKNLTFFEQNVFQNENDILSTKLNRKDIFAHKTINSNFFGKIIILPNGNILPNINSMPIGNIKNGIKSAIYEEMVNGIYWKKTRNSISPCKQCLYRDLCPPISNYEIIMDKMDLCHIKKSFW